MTVSQLISRLQHIQAANDYGDVEIVGCDDFSDEYLPIHRVSITERNADNYCHVNPGSNARRVVCLNLSR